jgi:hypothetical protein
MSFSGVEPELRGGERGGSGVVALDDVLVPVRAPGGGEDPLEVDHPGPGVGERGDAVHEAHVLDVELPDSVAELRDEADRVAVRVPRPEEVELEVRPGDPQRHRPSRRSGLRLSSGWDEGFHVASLLS